MNNYDEYSRLLKRRLKKNRYLHSLGCMETAGKLAERYGFDVEKARLTGLLHDITKNNTVEEHRNMFKKYDIEADNELMSSEKIFHSVTGAYYLLKELEIEDEEIFSAIRYHTTGRANMTLLEKIIYVADFIEPNRKFREIETLRKISFEDIDKAVFFGVQWCILKNTKKGKYIYRDTFECYNYYCGNLY